MRADIIAEKEKLDIDFVEGIRVPLPVEATNPKMLGQALYSREFRMKENFRKTKTELFAKLGDDPDLQFVVTHTEFIELRGDIRRKKKNVMDLLVQCERNDFRPFLQIIAVMSTIEAQLLLLLRAAAQFVDKKLGMYGKPLPMKVYKLAIRLFLTTTLESCRSFPLSREITFLLDSLRNETRKYVRDWYNNDEKDCEKVFTEKINVASMEQKYMMCYELSKEDFSDELDSHVDVMLRYLRLEQIEMERLLCQLCQVKRARYYWPTEWVQKECGTLRMVYSRGAPEFSLNIHSGTVNAFCTNFDQGMSPEEVATIQRHAEFVLHESTLTTSIGEEIINTAQNIMKELHLVPEGFEITRAFKERFRTLLGDELLDERTSDEVACQVADIIINDLEMSNARARYGRQGGNSRMCSERVAAEVCTKYMAYIANPMPSMRIQIPNDFPILSESDDEESASDETESDYATDEGQMVGHESSSDNESREDAEEGSDDDETENGSEDGSEDGSEEGSEEGSEDGSDEGTEHSESEQSEASGQSSREALLAAAMFNALSLDAVANAALMSVANNAIFAQDPYRVLEEYEVVPDELIDAFLACFQGVNRNIHPDLADVDWVYFVFAYSQNTIPMIWIKWYKLIIHSIVLRMHQMHFGTYIKFCTCSCQCLFLTPSISHSHSFLLVKMNWSW